MSIKNPLKRYHALLHADIKSAYLYHALCNRVKKLGKKLDSLYLHDSLQQTFEDLPQELKNDVLEPGFHLMSWAEHMAEVD